jgi:hypothetical protein
MLPLVEGTVHLSGEAQRKMYINLPVIEPIAVTDTYVSGVACVEDLGDDMFRAALSRWTDGLCRDRVADNCQRCHDKSLAGTRHPRGGQAKSRALRSFGHTHQFEGRYAGHFRNGRDVALVGAALALLPAEYRDAGHVQLLCQVTPA